MRYLNNNHCRVLVAACMIVLIAGPVVSQETDREKAYAQLAADAAEADRISRVMRTAAELTFPSVVHIETMVIKPRATDATSGPRSGAPQRVEEIGSGIIILIDGKHWVVTNSHVVRTAQPDAIHVLQHDRRPLTTKRILISGDFDIAVVEIDETNLTSAKLGSSAAVQATDMVLVIGSPYGLSGSISHGIISATGRRNIPQGEHPVPLLDMLQTDAAINPGNSGGPLVNLRGEVIGLISAIASSSGANEGVGFAIPIDDAIHVAENLVRFGEMQRPYIGVELAREITPEEYAASGIGKHIGAKITAVTPASPAAVAGLHAGDILLKFDEVEIEDDSHFIRLVARSGIGDQPVLTVVRFGETLTVRPVLTTQKK